MNSIYKDQRIIPVYKPVNWTSFDVVRYVKKLLKPHKAGHGGTLDPFAEGVLLILLNEATKRMREILSLRKRYLATLKLGEETDTLDCTGKCIESKALPSLSAEKVEEVLQSFEGWIWQETPLYSARKHKGIRLYKYAREGKAVKPSVREVQIFSLKLVDWNSGWIQFEAEVSSGTYIRTLGRDIARRLGTAGHLSKLIRTAVGEFTIESALQIEEIKEKCAPVTA